MFQLQELFSLDRKVALVTGASSGLGVQLAHALAGAGAAVICAARRVEGLERTVCSIRKAGGEASAIPMDVTSIVDIRRCLTEAEKRYGLVSILVNNAGISGSHQAMHEIEGADWERAFQVNTTAALTLTQEVAARLIAGGHTGSIINIASILGITPAPGIAAYPSTKAATLMVTKELALSLSRYGIRVNAIAPGYFRTEMNEAFLDQEYGQAMVRKIPMRRTGNLTELNGALLLLASNAGSFMTGSVIVVDGGQSSRMAGL